MGGSRDELPPTLWSLVLSAKGGDRRRLEALIQDYWKPVYWIFRLKWGLPNEEAKDATQEFFTGLLERDALRTIDPAKGRFRSFLFAALDNFQRNRRRDAGRLKRGGGRLVLSDRDLPIEGAAAAPSASGASEVEIWAQTLLRDAVESVRRQYASAGRADVFGIWEAFDAAEGVPPTYAELAARFGRTEDSVRGALRRVRADLRLALRERILPTVADPSEVDAEIEHLFGPPAGS